MIEKPNRGVNPLVRRGAPGRDRTCDHRIRRVRRAVRQRLPLLLAADRLSVIVRGAWVGLPSALPSDLLHRQLGNEPASGLAVLGRAQRGLTLAAAAAPLAPSCAPSTGTQRARRDSPEPLCVRVEVSSVVRVSWRARSPDREVAGRVGAPVHVRVPPCLRYRSSSLCVWVF
jgi:hypothetical protein